MISRGCIKGVGLKYRKGDRGGRREERKTGGGGGGRGGEGGRRRRRKSNRGGRRAILMRTKDRHREYQAKAENEEDTLD